MKDYTYENTIANEIWTYTGPMPVDPADVAEAIGDGADFIRFAHTITIDDLLFTDGIEGWQDYLDTKVGLFLYEIDATIDYTASQALPPRERAYTLVLDITASLEAVDIRSEQSEVKVKFFPEAWIDDEAVTVDPQGEDTWNVSNRTADMIDENAGLDHLDFAQFDAFAPKWVRNWNGPFEIRLVTDPGN